MPTETERSGSWSELEQGFFATAPPEVPEPPPEPMRFDDLDVGMPPRPDWRARLRRVGAAASAARGALRPRVIAAARRSVPVMARARQRSSALSVRVVALLRSRTRDRRMIAAAVAALIVVMGVSAGVVASRGAARATSAVKTVAVQDIPAAAAAATVQAPPAASDLPAAFEEVAVASLSPIEPQATKPPPPVIRKRQDRPRKYEKGPGSGPPSSGARAREKGPAKRLPVPAARPVFSR